MSRGGNLSVFLNAREYDQIEKNSAETGINKSQLCKMALYYFNNSNVLKELKKVHQRNLEMGNRTLEEIRGTNYEKKGE